MADPRFFETLGPISVREAVAAAGARLASGDPDAMLTHPGGLDGEADNGVVIFCEKAGAAERRILAFGLCFAPAGARPGAQGAIAETAAPKLAFARVAAKLIRSRPAGERKMRFEEPGVIADSLAFVASDAGIGANVRIGAGAYVGPGVTIGDDTEIGPGAFVSHALVGRRVVIASGARIGGAGFGFAPGPDGLVRTPQLGRVLIGDDVEIGANTAIDRGALGDTVIGDGTKIDNLVQIGHNVRLGRHCVIAAQTGISGSCVIGDGVMMGGQVGLADHLVIGDGALIAAGSGLMRDVPPGEKWGGAPARPIREWLRETAALAKLARRGK